MCFVFVNAERNQWCLFILGCCRPIFTFEIYLPSDRVFLFGAETSESQRKWTETIAKVSKYCVITLNPEKFLNSGVYG